MLVHCSPFSFTDSGTPTTTAYKSSEREREKVLAFEHPSLQGLFVNVAIQSVAALYILLECKVFLLC